MAFAAAVAVAGLITGDLLIVVIVHVERLIRTET